MNELLTEPATRRLLRLPAERAGEARGGDLRFGAKPNERSQELGPGLEHGIALRMGDHRSPAIELNLVQSAIDERRDRVRRELDQHKTAAGERNRRPVA